MSGNREATPEIITDDIQDFARDVNAEPPVFAPADSDFRDRLRILERQCRLRGGKLLFGRAISSADDLYVVAEWHCVASTPQGLIDVTPNLTGETRMLFAAVSDLSEGGELHRPNVRARIYGVAGKRTALKAKS